jgi:REP element-mobilizing transposase RayT
MGVAIQHYICCFKMPAAVHQLSFKLRPRPTWGGKRKGAGRKPAGAKAGVPHQARPTLASRHPVHITLRVVPEVASLRTKEKLDALKRAFRAASDRGGFRLVHFSVQGNHMHLIVEASDRDVLTRGVKGLEVRVARRLNQLAGRSGRVFGDRYHAHQLKTPREVRAALAYVLLNHRRHGDAREGARIDRCSSGMYFDGWRLPVRAPPPDPDGPVVAAPRTWLLSVGWRRRGLIGLSEIPGPL